MAEAPSGTDPAEPSDGSANTYILIARQTFGGNQFSWWYALNGNASAGTLTCPATVDRTALIEFTTSIGTVTYNSHHAEQSAAFGTATDGITSGAFTTQVDGSLILGWAGDAAITAGTGFTQDAQPFVLWQIEHLTQATAGSIAATFTQGSAGTRAAMGVAFDTASDPPPPAGDSQTRRYQIRRSRMTSW